LGRRSGARHVPYDNDLKTLNVRTTRIFQLINGRWRQMHHHGSIEDAKLLADYQNAVRSASAKKQ